jgi:hypothetical protein
MKCINEKDFKYIGESDGWLRFESQPKPKFDPEVVLVKKARFYKKSGESILLTITEGGKVTARAYTPCNIATP